MIDVKKFHLHIDPDSIPAEDRDFIASYLINNVPMTIDEEKGCRAQFDYKARDRKIASWLSKKTKEKVTEWWIVFAKEHAIPKNAPLFSK